MLDVEKCAYSYKQIALKSPLPISLRLRIAYATHKPHCVPSVGRNRLCTLSKPHILESVNINDLVRQVRRRDYCCRLSGNTHCQL